MRLKKHKERIELKGEYIQLEQLLKLAGLAETGGLAKAAIQSGQVKLNGETCLQRGKKLRDGDIVSFQSFNIEVTAKNAGSVAEA
ncbi:MAG: RNA-binding S4 domain-containing protein [Oscillospiraceae bacterium]|jgi:ribosome-associated protein|nr:RNA-binding S4 domain-containing protein [Oscillospiraceae bacterium]